MTTEFSAGAAIGRTFAVCRRNLVAFAAVALVIQSPAVVLTAIWDSAARPAAAGPSRALWTLSSLLGYLAAGALTSGALRGARGRRAQAREMLRVGFGRFWNVLRVSVVAQLAVLLGIVLLVVPGLALAAGLWVAIPAAVVEPWKGTSDTLSRSWELTKGRRWSVLGAALVTVVVALGIGLLATIALDAAAEWGASGPVIAAAQEAVTSLAAGFIAVGSAVSYHDLRVAREGMEAPELAAVFD
jgi:hypothetical protein